MPRLADAKNPKEVKEPEVIDDKPRMCMFHQIEMVVEPFEGTTKHVGKDKKVLRLWGCNGKNHGDKKCSYKIYIIE